MANVVNVDDTGKLEGFAVVTAGVESIEMFGLDADMLLIAEEQRIDDAVMDNRIVEASSVGSHLSGLGPGLSVVKTLDGHHG